MNNLSPEEKEVGRDNYLEATGVSRRDFMKGLVTTGAVTGAGLGGAYFGYSKVDNPVRIGVIGTGDEGNILLPGRNYGWPLVSLGVDYDGRPIHYAEEYGIEFDPDEPLDKMRCIMEQGYLCLGVVTRAGCAGKEGAPRCISARQSCRGCFGPIRKGAKPLVDMMGALSSIGQDAKSVTDRRAMLNRFVGAHKNLRPLPARRR